MINVIKASGRGFTLVELIAVILILGIIASIAVPKYFSLMEDAQQKALDGGLAEGQSRIFLHFAKQAINGTKPDDIIYDNALLGTNAGDFSLSYTDMGDNIVITVTGLSGNITGVSKARVIERPQ